MGDFIDIGADKKDEYNKVVNHPLQSYEWGEFRKKTGIKVIRRGLISKNNLIDGFTLTLHKVPRTKFYIGYLPKGSLPTDEVIRELRRIGKEENCIFIQLEPDVERGVVRVEGVPTRAQSNEVSEHWREGKPATGPRALERQDPERLGLRPAAHPLFTKYTFILDLTRSEEALLASMHSKTRYNIKVAEKHGVKIIEDNSKEAFEHYLKLTNETTSRQGFYAHTPSYHRNLFDTFGKKASPNTLSYHLLNAIYKSSILTSWVLFIFKDALYYPYGASSRLNRETMSSNLMMWEAIKFGKKLGLKKFDMWGALGPEPDKRDPWYGFHRFKEGYGGELVEFVGSYDFVIKPMLYELYKIADKLRWGFLRLKRTVNL